MSKEDLKILNLLGENEKAVAGLYACFAQKSPKHKEFWNELVREEIDHFQWIDELRAGIEEGTIKVDRRKFPIEMLQGSVETIKELTDRAENNASSLAKYSDQLEIAFELEEGMIEKNFFKAFDTDDDLIKSLLGKLQVATNEHRQRIKKELEQSK